MTITRTQAVLLSVAALIIAIVMFVGGRGFSGCGCAREPDPIVLGIDAGPGEAEINARLDGAIQAGEARAAQIDRKFQDDVAAFDERQAEEYRALRGGDDLEATARYLSAWSTERRTRDGGTR